MSGTSSRSIVILEWSGSHEIATKASPEQQTALTRNTHDYRKQRVKRGYL